MYFSGIEKHFCLGAHMHYAAVEISNFHKSFRYFFFQLIDFLGIRHARIRGCQIQKY
jgi:hypothetical protein